MKEKSNKAKYIADSLIVLINLAGARGNILLYWLTGLNRTTLITAVVIVLDVLYCLYRFSSFQRNNRIKFPSAISIIIALLLINNLNVLLDGNSIVLYTEYTIMILLFSYILLCLSREYPLSENGIKLISRGYIWVSLLSILGVFLSFLLIQLIGQQLIPIDVDFIQTNVESGLTYYRSYFSVNEAALTLRVPFFQDNGILCGLFHEPHIFAQNVFPCLILLLGFSNNALSKWLIIISGVLVIFFTGSATNIIVTLICLAVFFLINAKKRLLTTILGVVAVVLAILYYISIDDTFFQFFLGRLEEDNYSQQYSLSLLQWAFTPHSFLGSNFLDTESGVSLMYSSVSTKDVGYILFIINVIFLVFFVINIIKLIKCKNKITLAIAIASLYYILHSAKIGMTVYIQTLLVLLVFLQVVTLSSYGRIKTTKKSLSN